MIVASQCPSAVSIRSYYTNCFDFVYVKRKYAVIFEHDYAFLCYFISHFQMLPALYCLVCNPIIFIWFKKSQHIACSVQTYRRLCNGFLCHQSLFICCQNMQIGNAAVQIASGI